MVLPLDLLHVSRRLRRTLRQGRFRVSLDTACRQVIAGCAGVARKHEVGTWITPEMAEAYGRLHDMGLVHSVETWQDDRLVGGLYGVALGGVFTAESMFFHASDASKVALITLVQQLRRWDFDLMDVQVYTEHLDRLGAREWPRSRFQETLRRSMHKPTQFGRWVLDNDLV
jgi:leucyl/phenylalanyl-tRNA--protein transferase